MKSTHPLPQKIMSGAIVAAMNVTPYEKLAINSDGFTVHHGTASGGQPVHSIKSRINRETAIGRATVTLQLGNRGEMTMTTTEAEVAFAQLLPQLAAINQGANTTAAL